MPHSRCTFRSSSRIPVCRFTLSIPRRFNLPSARRSARRLLGVFSRASARTAHPGQSSANSLTRPRTFVLVLHVIVCVAIFAHPFLARRALLRAPAALDMYVRCCVLRGSSACFFMLLSANACSALFFCMLPCAGRCVATSAARYALPFAIRPPIHARGMHSFTAHSNNQQHAFLQQEHACLLLFRPPGRCHCVPHKRATCMSVGDNRLYSCSQPLLFFAHCLVFMAALLFISCLYCMHSLIFILALMLTAPPM